MTLRVMLDSNAFNALALDDDAREIVECAVAAGRLELVVTHVQIDEIDRTPDEERRRALRTLTVGPQTNTAGIVWDVSRFDMANFATDDELAVCMTP